MTIGLEKAFGLPALNDVLKEHGIASETRGDPTDTGVELVDRPPAELADMPEDLQNAVLAIGEGLDHGDAMDVIFDETTRLARDTADMAWQVDMARQARFIEVAGTLYKTAIDAKNSKRDFQLKTMKLAIELKRLDQEKQGGSASGHVVQDGSVFHADRNEIIAQALASRKKDGPDAA